ncbi:MAG: type I-C CRISPR-associated protein Cas8c/Csd1 [Gammaproteobacteria bacterium HGW-Gammaproteobacteria-4]|jgi:CRISPR-associated protein Csd1|nr:MAG: type I-C CRISPR-associated protein Cas8c/Csd1 [Gammaproteobacteria bacterium HGW-Gammaproteobacteria-4]
MSWIQKLYETYEQCKGHEPEGAERLLPVSHTFQQAHVEVSLDSLGNFKSARTLGKEDTVIPATEKSAGRTGKAPPPHPLCDKVQYCAGDYTEMGGGKPSFFKDYETQLAAWCASAHRHPKAEAILAYVRKNRVIADLVTESVLHLGPDGKLLNNWGRDTPVPEVFKVLTSDAKTKLRDQGNVFIRWRVHEPDNPCSAVWEDEGLQAAWAKYDASAKATPGICMVTGEAGVNLALSHPKRIRHAGDGAKLISANDGSGFTFRGRFTDDTGQQACGVGYEVTQKAHNALRWLIQRQAYRNGDQVIVSWAVGGAPIPDPFGSSLTLLLAGGDAAEAPTVIVDTDAGQAFAKRLSLAMRGYRARLGPADDIVVMGLDSATPGRMAITFYRELTGSEFLARIERWHIDFAWHQNFGKDKHFVGAPAPHDIAEAAYGRRLDDKLKKATVERLLPCIIDGQALPRDLLDSTIRRACNRVGLERWEWEKFLGIACGLYRGAFKNEGYEMTLETNRRSRDYLYGRLLAVAEHIESRALYVAGEKRDTTSSKLMQRFADRPASTWRIIEPALTPYISRLRAKRAGFMFEMDKLLDQIISCFMDDDFLDDSKLSGEFLLGYHCQRQALNPPKPDVATAVEEDTSAD